MDWDDDEFIVPVITANEQTVLKEKRQMEQAEEHLINDLIHNNISDISTVNENPATNKHHKKKDKKKHQQLNNEKIKLIAEEKRKWKDIRCREDEIFGLALEDEYDDYYHMIMR